MNYLTKLFSSDGFMPHGHCYFWNPSLVRLHVISDGLIALAYLTIPFTLVYIARKRKDMPFDWMFACFGIFILACGTTHALEIWTLWTPTYWLSGTMKAITAAASVATAILLVKLIPKLLAIPNPSNLHQAISQLRAEAAERHRAEEKLHESNALLESRVAERTDELEAANAELRRKISERVLTDEKIRWLASLPEQNPNLIAEFERQNGALTYANPAAVLLFPGLSGIGLAHPMLTSVRELMRGWNDDRSEMIRSEASLGEGHFAVTISYFADTQRVRLYGTEITERKEAEEALRESEMRVRLATETTGVGIWEWNVRTGKIRWDAELFRIYGIAPTPDGIVNYSDWSGSVEPEDLARNEEILQDTVRRCGRSRRVFRIRRRDNGQSRVVEALETARRNAKGSAEWVVGTNLDITERRAAEEALRLSEGRFQTLANAMPQLAWMAQPDGFITWYNERWYTYTGTTPEQMEGWGWQNVHDPEALPKVLEQWRGSIATAEQFNMTFPLRRADGVFRLFLTRGVPLKDEEGQVLGWFGTNTDVDELKRAEEAAARLAAIVEFSLDAIIGKDLEGNVTSWNAGAERMFGYSAREMVGQPLDRIIPQENHADEVNNLSRSKHFEYSESYEARRLCKDGTLIDVSVTISPIKDTEGRVVGASTVARDITERKRAEQMKISLEEKEVLLREIHHRVKNNLQVITSLIQLQSSYLRDPRDVEIFKECQARIHAMGLIHDRLYRSENLATIDFSEHLRELIALITRSQSGAVERIRLVVKSEPLEVNLDTAIPLGLITAELITNAYKHAFRERPGGLISVGLARTGPSRVTLSVEDDGVGMPAGFDPETVSSLGLRLTRTLVRQLRAELSITSSNTGSMLQVTFPLQQP